MYTEELKGNLFGLIPITFSPKTPPPLNVPFAFFTDVKVTQAGQFGGTLTVPGPAQLLHRRQQLDVRGAAATPFREPHSDCGPGTPLARSRCVDSRCAASSAYLPFMATPTPTVASRCRTRSLTPSC